MLYAGPNQINVQVPFETYNYGIASVQVVLQSGGISLDLPVTPSIGIFTADGVHAAALNQDGSINSPSNPAARGSIVTLFGTGALFWPPGTTDGAVSDTAAALDQELNALQVVDDRGAPETILYFGTAPGMIFGVFQLNVQPPQGAVPPLKLMRGTTGLVSNAVQVYLK
jgi:uncharacterized protein (TIGR03437 family)